MRDSCERAGPHHHSTPAPLNEQLKTQELEHLIFNKTQAKKIHSQKLNGRSECGHLPLHLPKGNDLLIP